MPGRPCIYHLSNAQRKELFVRGSSLLIALPAPPHEIRGSLEDWAASVLPADCAELITSAERRDICVNPLHVGGDGLSGVLGAIVHHPDSQTWLLTVRVIAVRLEPLDCRRVGSTIQWPAECVFRGRKIG